MPADLETVRQLIEVMRTRGLGNGFDPGPGPSRQSRPILDLLAENRWPTVFYSGAVMQIQGGRAVFGPEEESALASIDRAGVFCAYQLGEWGYYFHNLSHHEPWWRDVYGEDYDTFQHLKKPSGLAGYNRLPTSKRECYEVLKTYYARPEAPWVLTEHGRKAAEVYRFVTRHDRGVPYTPVAIVLDRYAGYNGYMDKPWGILDPTPSIKVATKVTTKTRSTLSPFSSEVVSRKGWGIHGEDGRLLGGQRQRNSHPCTRSSAA